MHLDHGWMPARNIKRAEITKVRSFDVMIANKKSCVVVNAT